MRRNIVAHRETAQRVVPDLVHRANEEPRFAHHAEVRPTGVNFILEEKKKSARCSITTVGSGHPPCDDVRVLFKQITDMGVGIGIVHGVRTYARHLVVLQQRDRDCERLEGDVCAATVELRGCVERKSGVYARMSSR
jgi:hypothetical protein